MSGITDPLNCIHRYPGSRNRSPEMIYTIQGRDAQSHNPVLRVQSMEYLESIYPVSPWACLRLAYGCTRYDYKLVETKSVIDGSRALVFFCLQ